MNSLLINIILYTDRYVGNIHCVRPLGRMHTILVVPCFLGCYVFLCIRLVRVLGFILWSHSLSIYIVMFSSEVFFTSSILVLALNMVLTWYLFSLSMYFGRFPIFLSLILFSRNLTFDFYLPPRRRPGDGKYCNATRLSVRLSVTLSLVVLASEAVGGRSGATELPCLILSV